MSDIILRAAQATDAGKAGAILSEFVDQTQWMPRVHTRAEDVAFVGSMIERGWVVVALRDQKVVGFVALNDGDVQSLYVANRDWRQGVGTTLLRHAQGTRAKLSLWTFQANEGAKAFYLAHGFVEAERTDGVGNDEQLPDIRFEWQKEAA